jgi:hypothetical protein
MQNGEAEGCFGTSAGPGDYPLHMATIPERHWDKAAAGIIWGFNGKALPLVPRGQTTPLAQKAGFYRPKGDREQQAEEERIGHSAEPGEPAHYERWRGQRLIGCFLHFCARLIGGIMAN